MPRPITGGALEFLGALFAVPGRKVYVRRVGRRREGSDERRSSTTPLVLVATVISYAMAVVLLVSLLAIVFVAIKDPTASPPAVLREIFFATLGYFGGAFIGFVKMTGEG